jgi:hypothetical protein
VSPTTTSSSTSTSAAAVLDRLTRMSQQLDELIRATAALPAPITRRPTP